MKNKFAIFDNKTQNDLIINYEKCIVWNNTNINTKKNVYNIENLINSNPNKYKYIYLRILKKITNNLLNNKYSSYLYSRLIGYNLLLYLDIVESDNLGRNDYKNHISLIVIEDILSRNNAISCEYYGSNIENSKAVEYICNKLNIRFKSHIKNKKEDFLFIKTFLYSFLELTRSFYWFLKYLIRIKPFFKKRNHQNSNDDCKNIFISYSDQLSSESIESGFLKSNYWGNLPKIIKNKNIRSKWIYLYVKDMFLETPKDTEKFINELNKSSELSDHLILDEYITIFIFIKVLLSWIIHIIISPILIHRIYKTKSKFRIYFSKSIFQKVTINLYSYKLIQGLLYKELFKKCLSYCKNAKNLIYLMENQFWERSLNIANKELHNINSYGYAHSTIRYWDLRYNSIYYKNKLIDYSSPDKILVTHPTYLNNLKIFYPKAKILLVESLRYSNINNNEIEAETQLNSSINSILFLSDYDNEINKKNLKTLYRILNKINSKIKLIIKPHPNTPVYISKKAYQNTVITNKSIENLINSAEIIFTSNRTSAAIDCILMNKKIYILPGDQGMPNESPLFYFFKNDYFLKNSKEVENIIKSESKNPNNDLRVKLFSKNKILIWLKLVEK